MSTPSSVPQGATVAARHTLSPIAAKSVEAIRHQPDMVRRYIRAVIAAEGEAYAALRALDEGWIKPEELAARLRDILAICEAAEGKS